MDLAPARGRYTISQSAQKHMLKSVVFDLDGVVVHSHPAHIRCWKTVLQRLGRTTTDEELDFVREGRRRDEILRHFLGELSESEMKACGEQKDFLFRQECASLQTITGIEGFLDSLRLDGITAAVASSGSIGRVHHILEALGLKNFFVAIVTGDDVCRGKPNPEIFQRAVDQLSCDPEEAIVFEDSVAGVEGAKAGGIKCIGIGQGAHARALLNAGADHVRSDFVGLAVDALRKLFH